MWNSAKNGQALLKPLDGRVKQERRTPHLGRRHGRQKKRDPPFSLWRLSLNLGPIGREDQDARHLDLSAQGHERFRYFQIRTFIIAGASVDSYSKLPHR